MQLVEKNDVTPICPHCDTQLTTIASRELRAFLGRRYIYFCPSFRIVLVISHRKCLLMG